MKNLHQKKRVAFFLALAGLLAGFINGLLSAGGGIIVVAALSKLMGDSLKDKNDIFANALCVMLPLSLFSCFLYAASGNLAAKDFGVFVLPAIIGGAVGGILLGKLRAKIVSRLFCSLIIISGIILIVR